MGVAWLTTNIGRNFTTCSVGTRFAADAWTYHSRLYSLTLCLGRGCRSWAYLRLQRPVSQASLCSVIPLKLNYESTNSHSFPIFQWLQHHSRQTQLLLQQCLVLVSERQHLFFQAHYLLFLNFNLLASFLHNPINSILLALRLLLLSSHHAHCCSHSA